MATFQRARSEEQREVRRRAILDVAMDMLTRMPVSQLTLNELARQVGLAKSNVLRYFETREAVLLDLLDAAVDDWLGELETALAQVVPAVGKQPERDGDEVARAVAAALSGRPVLCDLLSAQAAVLERNVSAQVAARHKRATLDHVNRFAAGVLVPLPRLGAAGAAEFAGLALLSAGALWSSCQPTPAMLEAYAADPGLARMRMEFEPALAEVLAVLLTGLLVRGAGEFVPVILQAHADDDGVTENP